MFVSINLLTGALANVSSVQHGGLHGIPSQQTACWDPTSKQLYVVVVVSEGAHTNSTNITNTSKALLEAEGTQATQYKVVTVNVSTGVYESVATELNTNFALLFLT